MKMKRLSFWRHLSSIAFVVCIIALACPDNAHAGYLDPGSGSTVVQGIIAFFAGMRRFLAKIFRRGKEE